MGREEERLYRMIAEEADRDNLWADIQSLNHWFRYTGTQAGEQAAEFIRQRLEACGIPVEWIQYPCYRSLPGEAFLNVPGRNEPISLTPYVYSGCAEQVSAEIIFDSASAKKGYTQRELVERVKTFRGKIVLTYDSSYAYAVAASRAGAKGILTIWTANLAHHGSIGGVWGTPGVEDLQRYPYLPFAEILKDDGEQLRRRLESGERIVGELSVQMENNIQMSSMPVARIQGKRDDFVLVSGHYDGWYEGITDNACANAAMLELARCLSRHRDSLERSVVLAWWSGHSDGRYAGSTYYFDTHFEELKEHCVAHINMDIAGCATSDLVAFNTSGMEGAQFDRDVLRDFNREEPQAPIPMDRFADQSFWGASVPFAIMPRFNRKELGDGIFYWWHTREDTLDKVDMDVLYRDYCVIGKLACLFAMEERLPFDLAGYINEMENVLLALQKGLHPAFTLESVLSYLPTLKKCAERLSEAYLCDSSLEKLMLDFAGELTRLTYTSSSPYGQGSAAVRDRFPGLSAAAGCTPENCEADYFLALQTDFIRQRNRLLVQWKELVQSCNMRLKLWELDQ